MKTKLHHCHQVIVLASMTVICITGLWLCAFTVGVSTVPLTLPLDLRGHMERGYNDASVGHIHNTSPNITSKRPIIGILAHVDVSQSNTTSFVLDSYVKYLEQAGAGVVLVRVAQNVSYYEDLFNCINGILIPGGMVTLNNSYYGDMGRMFYKWAIQANLRGDYFPLWGTCLGFELLSTVTAETHILTRCNALNILLPLKLTKDFRQSRLFAHMPLDLIKLVEQSNVTQNHHINCVTEQDFLQNVKLRSFYRLLSTSIDLNGKTFVSTMEGKRYPFYGVQWHPEKNAFTWDVNQVVNHSADAIRMAQYMAAFFVSEARKSRHRFKDDASEAAALVENYHAKYLGYPSFYSRYVFKVPPYPNNRKSTS